MSKRYQTSEKIARGKESAKFYTCISKSYKDTLSWKPRVILTPAMVLFWNINLGQRKEIKNIKVTFAHPSESERERQKLNKSGRYSRKKTEIERRWSWSWTLSQIQHNLMDIDSTMWQKFFSPLTAPCILMGHKMFIQLICQ